MSDLLYLLMLILPLLAQVFVSGRYKKFLKEENSLKMSGYDVARKILDSNGLNALYIVETKGTMSDHYDPTRKTVRLSTDVFHGTSISALAIAAHECGHAIQDKEGYTFFKLRSMIIPVVNLGTKFSYIVLFIGMLMQIMDLITLGIVLVGLGLIFQLVTLPVELNASKRALGEIEKNALGNEDDKEGTEKMLKAAAYTYVAGVITSAMEIVRLIMIFKDNE